MPLPSRDPSLAQHVRRRNATELGAAAVVFVVFGVYAVVLDPWPLRLGAGLLMLGVASVATTLWRRGPLEPAPAEPSLAWQRRQLERQRDLLASVPRWYLAPLLPGTLVFLGGMAWATPSLGLRLAIGAAGVALVALGSVVARHNLQAAQALDRELEGLLPATGNDGGDVE